MWFASMPRTPTNLPPRSVDASYKEAKSRLEELGNVYLVKSATLDSLDTTGKFVLELNFPTRAANALFISRCIRKVRLDVGRYLDRLWNSRYRSRSILP
jgi:hypothetical protein